MSKTIYDMLEKARMFHQDLASLYRQLGDVAEKKRVQMLLDYMSRHETHLEHCIKEFESEASADMLNSQIRYEPEAVSCRCFEDVQLSHDMTVSEVVAEALRLDECLVRFYRQVAEGTSRQNIRNLFLRLMELEQAEERLTVRNALEVDDF